MPTIQLNKKRVLELSGAKLSDEKLKEKIAYLGTDLESVDSKEIVVEIFPNRPDMLSEEGFSRALSSFLENKTGLKKYSVKKSNCVVNIKKEVKQVRPFTACAVIKGLKINKEKLNDIIEIQEKLHITYGRNRKKCAIGIYPMEAIKFPIEYTAKKPEDINFIPLGRTKPMNGKQILKEHEKGKEYAHLLIGQKKYPVFIDANNEILSVPPIINSEKTGKITGKTTDVFVECSGFEFNVLEKAINMIATALSDMGGKIYSVTLNFEDKKSKITPNLEPEKIIFDKKYVEKNIGKEFTDKEITSSLQKMGYNVKITKNKIEAHIPAYRSDILHPIDVVEDIMIGYGYNKLEGNNTRVYSTGKESYTEKIKRKIREILAGAGLLEANSLSLMSEENQKRILELKSVVKIANASTTEYNSLRNKIILSLLQTLKNNKQYEYPQEFFEIGTVFTESIKETKVTESNSLAVVSCGDAINFTKARQYLDLVMSSINQDYEVEKAENPVFLKGRSGKIIWKNKTIGYIGELNPKALNVFSIEMPASGFEIDVDHIITQLKKESEE